MAAIKRSLVSEAQLKSRISEMVCSQTHIPPHLFFSADEILIAH